MLSDLHDLKTRTPFRVWKHLFFIQLKKDFCITNLTILQKNINSKPKVLTLTLFIMVLTRILETWNDGNISNEDYLSNLYLRKQNKLLLQMDAKTPTLTKTSSKIAKACRA
jgi:hypothetical protein